jgi:hypothetical protein
VIAGTKPAQKTVITSNAFRFIFLAILPLRVYIQLILFRVFASYLEEVPKEMHFSYPPPG